MKKGILHYGNQMSNQSLTTPTKVVEILDKNIHRDIQQMHDVLDHCGQSAAGLAANQIGKDCRIFVYRDDHGRVATIINPDILEHNGTSVEIEGCLSFPNTWSYVKRFTEIKVSFFDFLSGEMKEKYLIGFNSRLFQHEIEHLNGDLFIDSLSKEERDEFLARYARDNRPSKNNR